MSALVRLQWLRWWWPALVWAALVTCFSTDSFSAQHTSRILIPFLHWLFPRAQWSTLAWVHHLIRKGAHVTEYFILSLLLTRGIRGARRGWRLHWAIAALAMAAGWAGLDELHQAFVPSRGAAMSDVLIDACGAAAGQIAFAAMAARREARREGQDGALDSANRIV